MSYEYKDAIQDSIIHYYDHVLIYNEYTDDVLDELDHVYAQADKADEYEAKAKAFDEIFKLYIGYEDGWISFPRGSKSFNKEIINVCKSYESGGTND